MTVAGGHGQGFAANQFDGPTDVKLDDAGNLYVADSLNNRVQRWAPGATTGVTVAGGNGKGWAANQFDQARAIAVDSVGNLYVADEVNDRLQLWTPGATSGVTVAGGDGQGPAADQFFEPMGVAVDNGYVYVSDFGNNRVQRWPAFVPTVLPGNGLVAAPLSGTATMSVSVTLNAPSVLPVTVPWRTLDLPNAPTSPILGPEAPPSDYTASSGAVSFAPGQTTAQVTIPVTGDSTGADYEYVVVSFHDPTGAHIGGFWGLGFGEIESAATRHSPLCCPAPAR